MERKISFFELKRRETKTPFLKDTCWSHLFYFIAPPPQTPGPTNGLSSLNSPQEETMSET